MSDSSQQKSDNQELNLVASYQVNDVVGAHTTVEKSVSMTEPMGAEATVAMYERSNALVDIANNTFRELCQTLETEQAKLLELEERRKKLQEEMQRLKAEIEEEKNFYKLNLVESVSENLQVLNKACNMEHTIEDLIEDDGSFLMDEYKESNEHLKAEQSKKIKTIENAKETEVGKPSTANALQSADSENGMKASLKDSNHNMPNQMNTSLTDSIMDQCLNNEALIEKFEREVKKLDA